MTREQYGDEVEQELNPRPWWVGTGEKLLNAVIIVLFGIPAMHYTEDPLIAGVTGIVGLAVVNVGYWKLVHRMDLLEVFDAYKP